MRIATLLIALALAPPAQNASTLPGGVKTVSFGQAQRYSAGKEMCVIPKPMPYPVVFDRGVTEISYAVQLEPRSVKSASARVIAPAGQELTATGCHVFVPIKGGFTQTQLGNTIARADKQPLRPGRYILRIAVDGQTAEVPFEIGRLASGR